MHVANNGGGDTNEATDHFVHDRQTGTPTRVSRGPSGAQASGPSSDSGGLVNLASYDSGADRENVVFNVPRTWTS